MLKSFFKYVLLFILGTGCANLYAQTDPWNQLDGILSKIKRPSFPKRMFFVKNYGADATGKKNCSAAIKAAIDACHKAGGGRVIIPAGRYLTGPVYLKSNVNLHLEKGATLLFSTKPDDYLPLVPTRWEGIELMNYSPLVYAYNEKNIAITGDGVLDGQATAQNWWPWKGKKEYGFKAGSASQVDKGNRPALFAMAEKDVPMAERRFGNGFYLRPQFVQPYKCNNVLIEGVRIINSPMWILNPVLCNNVTISKVTVESEGPNTDGCDPESCKNVLIKDCYFNTGDDCIALKSGRNRDGRRIGIPCENVVIQGCTMANGHGGVVIGSEISGGAKNIFAENCTMNSPELDRALRIKTSSARGGVIENIYMRNIKVGQVKQEAILVTMFYEDKGNYMPLIKNIEVSNMQVDNGGNTGVVVEGYKEQPVQYLKLTNVTINNVKKAYNIANLKGLQLKNVVINGTGLLTEQVKITDEEKKLHY
ncbi:glycoside hydrolase family 28 protein [Mucilaginibacter aquatilis]|uniref:Glycoside hydrolase family 28 protein n=1 Tax=Mucilaginibacter aquatilis TaxID=1517760 RepID=A0A6I4I993_9SPHI|nr:glycoside hydrolase family 28 protein [Mucilaginibacter aquatilis]MVN91671.1 glycoside hydrolase family 28 protein [Mucilaginibacter aquatilis]